MLYTAIALFVKHFVISGLFIFWMWKRDYRSKVDWLFMVIFVGVYISLIYLTGQWHIYGYYFRYLMPVLFFLAMVDSLRTIKPLPWWVRKHSQEWFVVIFMSLVSIIFMSITLWAYYGRYVSTPGIELQFPLKQGTYYIIEGGNSPWINTNHHYPDIPFKYSIDISKLNRKGSRANGMFPHDPHEYAIFGETVYSPCGGIVTTIIDSLPDSGFSQADTTIAALWGNQLKIRCPEYCVLLGFLRRGGFKVSVGDTVRAGEPLAEVGYSGAVSEPMLHIHAFRAVANPPWEGKGVPIFFRDRFLIRNDMVEVP